jgi:hypothetical protein
MASGRLSAITCRGEYPRIQIAGIFRRSHHCVADECCGGEGAQSSDAGLCQGNEVHHLPAVLESSPRHRSRGDCSQASKEPTLPGQKGFEATDQNGHIVGAGAVSQAMLAEIKSGRLLVRQKPGPRNALGLVKFMFPNEFDVYLHSTPAPELFNQSRRDFSHGCIRVEKPAELAAWLLQDQPKWTLEKIKAAMQSGPDNQQVNLSRPVPVVIVYLTAIVEENGEVYFYDDIYGLDGTLNDALAKSQTNR